MKLTPFLAALVATSAWAQDADKDYSADTKTIESTVAALYDVISGDKGVKRDWARFHNLFAPGARMMPVFKNQAGKMQVMPLTPKDYETRGGQMLEQLGFYEKEVASKVEVFGPIAHVFSTYESFEGGKGGKLYGRGINSIQLTFDGDRWWVQNISWADEKAAGPVPDKYKGG